MRYWAMLNANFLYVPEDLLRLWGIRVADDFFGASAFGMYRQCRFRLGVCRVQREKGNKNLFEPVDDFVNSVIKA